MKYFNFSNPGAGIKIDTTTGLASTQGFTVEVKCRIKKLSYDATLFALLEDDSLESLILRLGFHETTSQPVFQVGAKRTQVTAAVSYCLGPVPLDIWVHVAGT